MYNNSEIMPNTKGVNVHKITPNTLELNLQNVLMQSPFAFAILKGKDSIVTLANDSIKVIWGKGQDVEGKSLFDILPEIKNQGFPELIDSVYTTGVPFVGEEMLVKLLRGGKLINTYFNFTYEPYREMNGTISGVTIIAYEVTAQTELNQKVKESERYLEKAVEIRTKELQEANAELQLKNQELALSKYNKIFLTEFSQKFAENTSQKDFFNALVQFVVEITGLDYAFVAQFKPNNPDEFTLETIAFSALGQMTENFDYSVIDGPCKEVIYGDLYNYADNARTLFPKGQLISQLNIEGYIGLPLYDSEGQAIGLVAVMHNKKIEDKDTVNSILKIVAKRAELELERIKNQKRIEESNKQLEKNNNELLQKNKELRQKNKEIEDSKLKLLSEYSRSLIEASLDPLIVISPKGRITDMNQAAINVIGKSRKVLRGTHFFDYFTEPQKAKTASENVFSKGFVTNYPLVIKDHKLTDVLFNGSVYKDEKGNVLGAVIVTRDITEQKRIEKDLIGSLKEITDYKYALDASSIVEVTDAQGIIKYVNPNFTKISQYTSDEIVGKSHRMVNSNFHSKELMSDLWTTISSGKIWKHDLKNKAKDGSFYWLATTIVPFVDDKGVPYQYVAIRTDITEQKRISEELLEAKVYAEEAKTKAEEAKTKAEEATLIAENAVKAKQQFLSNMSHEIRTPMNAIIGFTKVMLKTELTGKQKEYLTAVKMSGDSLIVLINDILDLAKVDAGKMTFEKTPFKLALSINAMLHLFEIKIQEKNLILIKEYDKNIPEVLLGDPVRLHQIILNLISNAVKFTAHGHIKVCVKMLHEDAKKVTIEFAIHDTGIGISADKIATIFDNFQQAAQDTPRLYGGTGLGLAIVKQLVEPQGGTITVKSKITEGSVFSFILDFDKTDEAAFFETEIMELDPDIKNIKVLVVEDMALNQLLMKTILDDFGFDRDIADNGKIAIEKLVQKNAFGVIKDYDIILMDLQMPEMNGFEATEYIRNTLKSKTPIIALTADVTTTDLAKCKAVGMNDYVAKPVDERLLYSKIVNLVKKMETANTANREIELGQVVKLRCTNMTYLMQRTKSNPALMSAMIDAYLEQTPPLIQAMKQSFEEKNWDLLHAAVHKMVPSFLIMGINNDFEAMAKKVMTLAKAQEEMDSVADSILKLEAVCTQACDELREELNKFKTK
jgi:PAS domain S-box-containing protein